MNQKTLDKITKTILEVGQKTSHDVHLCYFTKTNTIQVQIYRDGFEIDKTPETMSSIFVDTDVILFTLISLLNEKEEAA